MAVKKKVTQHNTGLSVSRKGSKFTATWKQAAKEITKQVVRFRTYNGKKWGAWEKHTISKKATSYSFTLGPSKSITKIQVQTCVLRDDEKKDGKVTVNYTTSDWDESSYTYKVKVPPRPGLSVSAPNPNRSVFTVTSNAKTDEPAWQYELKYRTKFGSNPWSRWADVSSPHTYNDTLSGHYRQFQVKAVGPAGETPSKSPFVSAKHYIGLAPRAVLKNVKSANRGSYYTMTYVADIKASTYTCDEIIPQYYIGTPTASMGCPAGVNWQDGETFKYNNSYTRYNLPVTTSDVIGYDECLWARVKTVHDGLESYSDAWRERTGSLTAPTCTITMGTPSSTGFSVTVTIDDIGSDVPGIYSQVFLERASKPGEGKYILIGKIPGGTSEATITSTEDIASESGYSIHVRNVTADGSSMKSAFYTYRTTMPSAPTLDAVRPTTVSGKVHVEWTNNWADANGTVIAWTDDPDNWMSNDEPDTYEVEEAASGWYIVGLETGKQWYFRVRSKRTVGENETLSSWSEEKSIDLASAPAIPTLYLSEEVITETGMVTAYWSYVTTDGTAQVAGNVVEGTVTDGVFTPVKTVGATSDAQHVDIYAADAGWTNGQTVYLALQTRSGSGGTSEYSTPVELVIAEKPTVEISSTNLASAETVTEYFVGDNTDTFEVASTVASIVSATIDGTATTATASGSTVMLESIAPEGSEVAITYTTSDLPVLTAMPLVISITPSGGTALSLAIERTADYPMDRPDGRRTDGPAGETIYLSDLPTETTSARVTISDCIGRLDDGAKYTIVATATDQYGQSDRAELDFIVHWAHQAWEPDATVEVDLVNYLAQITPIAGADWAPGDTCDIYRLSNERPELIFSGARFGTTYVDPYPAFTENSGYRIVTVTATGDYITPENALAYIDIYTNLNPGTLVIDFEGDRVELPYNLTLSSTWAKDHKRTTYLGGSVVGDYNRAVTRDVSVGTALIRNIDEATAIKMHDLAMAPTHCHVRTPDGSSFEADVQVQENRAYSSAGIEYTLTVQKTDTTGFDAMTLADWEERQQE